MKDHWVTCGNSPRSAIFTEFLVFLKKNLLKFLKYPFLDITFLNLKILKSKLLKYSSCRILTWRHHTPFVHWRPHQHISGLQIDKLFTMPSACLGWINVSDLRNVVQQLNIVRNSKSLNKQCSDCCSLTTQSTCKLFLKDLAHLQAASPTSRLHRLPTLHCWAPRSGKVHPELQTWGTVNYQSQPFHERKSDNWHATASVQYNQVGQLPCRKVRPETEDSFYTRINLTLRWHNSKHARIN